MAAVSPPLPTMPSSFTAAQVGKTSLDGAIVQGVLGVVRALEGPRGVKWDDVLAESDRRLNLPAEVADAALNALLNEGVAFEPFLGIVRSTESLKVPVADLAAKHMEQIHVQKVALLRRIRDWDSAVRDALREKSGLGEHCPEGAALSEAVGLLHELGWGVEEEAEEEALEPSFAEELGQR